MNIGSKLIFSFVLVTLLPTVLIAYVTTNFINSSNKEDAQATINHNLKAAWMQYYARAHQMQYGMLQASTESHIIEAVDSKDARFLRKQLLAWKKNRPYVDLWVVVDRDTKVISSLNGSSGWPLSLNGLTEKSLEKNSSFISSEVVPYDVLKQEGLEDLSRVTFYIEQDGVHIEEGEFRDGLMLVVVTPIADEKGVIGAVITGDLINNDSFVPDTLAESIPGSLATIALGNVQVSTNVKNEAGQRTIGHLLPPEVTEELARATGFRGEATVVNTLYMTAFDPITNYEGRTIGSIFVGVPKERFVELQHKNMKAVMTIAIVGLFVAAGFASLLTYLITRPIKSLTRKAQLVSAGNLNFRAGDQKADSNDEISDLARTFDIMVKSLREKEERIEISQDKLRQQKNLIESIINSLPYCLYVLERNISIIAWNRHSASPCPVCNCSSKDCTNLNFITHLSNPALQHGLEDVITSVFESGAGRTLEHRITMQENGKEIIIRTSIFPILSGSQGTDYVVWMAEDITKQKELEASIISSEKLAAIGQLAAGIAHEVNNPLGGILNCLYNFKNKKLTEERKAEYLDFMGEGIKRVQNIVRQLLDFSQQHAPELTLTDINRIIEGLTPLFLHSIKGRDIRLLTNLGQGLPPILVDKHQIEQILVNLILNAIQAVHNDGRIEITTRFEGSWYCITVADNGSGIPAENIPRIFDPFFTTKGVGKGTGLGLSVSRGIIERHKGRIEVESQLGKGSTFKVYLPITT